MFKKSVLLALPFFCAACGTFQLANNIHAPAGKTAEQQQSDVMFCKDEAKMAASTAEKQTQAFLLGMTIVGAGAAYDIDKKTQREAFAKCMRARGYTLQIADDGHNTPTQTSQPIAQVQPPAVQETASPKQAAPTGQLENNNIARLEALKSLKDKGIITQADYNKKKQEILDAM